MVIIDNNTDLVFSPDDKDETGKGYYLQQFKRGEKNGDPNYPLTRISILYATETEARESYQNGSIKWEDWD